MFRGEGKVSNLQKETSLVSQFFVGIASCRRKLRSEGEHSHSAVPTRVNVANASMECFLDKV